jgi:hypothetical protein
MNHFRTHLQACSDALSKSSRSIVNFITESVLTITMVKKIALETKEIKKLRACLSNRKFRDGHIEVDVPWTLHNGRDSKGLRLLPQAEGYHQKILGRLSTEGIRPVYLDQIHPTGTYPPWMKEENQIDDWSKFLRSTGATRNRRQAEAKRREKKEDKQDGGDGENALSTEYIPQPSEDASLQAPFIITASCGNSTMRTGTVFERCGHEQPNVDGQYRLNPTIGQPGSYPSHIYGLEGDSFSFLPHHEFPLGYSLYGSLYSIPLYGSASTASQGILSWESQADSRVLYMPPGHPRPFDLPYQQYDPTHHTRGQVQYEENRGEGNDEERTGSYYGI